MEALQTFYFAEEMRPFTIAAIVMVGLFLVELTAMLLGGSLAEALDGMFGLDGEIGTASGAFGFLNPAGVPTLVLLIVALAAFAISGMAVQKLSVFLFSGTMLSWPIASTIAILASLPTTRVATRLVAAALPKTETTALRLEDLVGLEGVVTLGPLDRGTPGLVRVVDGFANTHTLRTRAAEGSRRIERDERVVLVTFHDGVFEALPADEATAPDETPEPDTAA